VTVADTAEDGSLVETKTDSPLGVEDARTEEELELELADELALEDDPDDEESLGITIQGSEERG